MAICAAPRANYLLHSLPPTTTAAYASSHDAEVGYCLSALLGLADAPRPSQPARAAPLALGLADWLCAQPIQTVSDRHAAYWASWMDTLPGLPNPSALSCGVPYSQLCATTELRGCRRSWLQHRQRCPSPPKARSAVM